MGVAGLNWTVASDPEVVHALLCASDRASATPASPPPARSIETTRARVRADAIHLLSRDDRPVAMFSLTREAPFAYEPEVFTPAERPVYLSRLAVDPAARAGEPLAGARCVRRALELAAEDEADVLRSQANPALTGVMRLLALHGFHQHSVARASDGQVYLERPLAASSVERMRTWSRPVGA